MILRRLLDKLVGAPAPRSALRDGGTFVATHMHRKGGAYRLLAQGVLESDRSAVAIYDDAEGTIWVRDLSEFHDGRFLAIAGGGQGQP